MTPEDHIFDLEPCDTWSATHDTPLWSPWQETSRPWGMLVVEVVSASEDRDEHDRPAAVEWLQWPTDVDRARFEVLADQWESETEFLALQAKAVMHPAYLKIIGMGPVAIPMILKRLEVNGGHWFSALAAIADVDAGKGFDSFDDAREAWLVWGKQHRYLTT